MNDTHGPRHKDLFRVPILFAFSLLATACSQTGSPTGRADRKDAPAPYTRAAERRDHTAAERDADGPVPRLFVNDDKIEVEDILRPIRAELKKVAETLSLAGYRQVLRDKILQEFRWQVRSLLLYQEAAKRLSEKEEEVLQGFVDDAVRRRVNTEFGGRQTNYEKALAEQGLTLLQDRERIRRDLVVMRHLHQTVMIRVLDPTRTELVRFFEEQKEELTKPERRKMSLIEIPLEATAARGLIIQANAELDAGASFADVAGKYSQGLHAEEGGSWGWLTRGSVREHWEPAVEVLFQLQEDQTSQVLETNEAVFIVRCDGIEPAVVPDFEALQPELVQAYRDMQFNRLVDQRVHELQQKAVFVPENIGRFLQAVAEASPKPKCS